jgi:hypothetical protein
MTAARKISLIDVLTDVGEKTFADKGHQGAGGTIRTPFKRHRHRPWLSRGQRDVNRSHARIHSIGERAIATLKAWKALTKLRYCRIARPRSCRPSSSSNSSKTAFAQDEKVSRCRLLRS